MSDKSMTHETAAEMWAGCEHETRGTSPPATSFREDVAPRLAPRGRCLIRSHSVCTCLIVKSQTCLFQTCLRSEAGQPACLSRRQVRGWPEPGQEAAQRRVGRHRLRQRPPGRWRVRGRLSPSPPLEQPPRAPLVLRLGPRANRGCLRKERLGEVELIRSAFAVVCPLRRTRFNAPPIQCPFEPCPLCEVP